MAHPRRVQGESPSAVARRNRHPYPAAVDRAADVMHSFGPPRLVRVKRNRDNGVTRELAVIWARNRSTRMASSFHRWGQVRAKARAQYRQAGTVQAGPWARGASPPAWWNSTTRPAGASANQQPARCHNRVAHRDSVRTAVRRTGMRSCPLPVTSRQPARPITLHQRTRSEYKTSPGPRQNRTFTACSAHECFSLSHKAVRGAGLRDLGMQIRVRGCGLGRSCSPGCGGRAFDS